MFFNYFLLKNIRKNKNCFYVCFVKQKYLFDHQNKIFYIQINKKTRLFLKCTPIISA